jgi:hypothetical protein
MDSSNSPSEKLLSPQQALFVYWFNGLFPILTSIVTPLTVYRKVLKKPNASDIQRYNDLLQEVSRQLVSGTIGLVSYFSGGALTRQLLNLFPEKQNGQHHNDDQHVKMIVGGSVLSFIGYSFLRPSIATDILYLLRKNETPEGKAVPAKSLSSWQKNLVAWIDQKLIKNGKPQLKKAALLSFGMLGTYLTTLAFAIYGISRLFHHSAIKPENPQQSPSQPTILPNRVLMPKNYSPPYYQPTFQSYYKNPI